MPLLRRPRPIRRVVLPILHPYQSLPQIPYPLSYHVSAYVQFGSLSSRSAGRLHQTEQSQHSAESARPVWQVLVQ